MRIQGYFSAKREHVGQIAKVVSCALKGVAVKLNKNLDDILKNVKKKGGAKE